MQVFVTTTDPEVGSGHEIADTAELIHRQVFPPDAVQVSAGGEDTFLFNRRLE